MNNIHDQDATSKDPQPDESAPNRKITPISAAIRARGQANKVALKPSAERPRILFLDDEHRILNALSALFRYKYQVFTATDGEQALAILRQHHVHVVVSDQRMPSMTGVEFLRRAKEVSPCSVRILLTGFSDLSAIIDSINEGEVYRFLNKPWGNNEIQAVIEDALSIGLDLEKLAPGQYASESAPGAIAKAALERTLQDEPAVVMLHDQEEVFEAVGQLLGGQPCVHTDSFEKCLQMLQAGNVAVLVCNLHVGKQDSSELLKLLKQQYPHVMIIVVADTADAENVIGLINDAKIFRYILIPCNPQKLKFFIDSGVTQFRKSVARPGIHSNASSIVEYRPDPTDISGMPQSSFLK